MKLNLTTRQRTLLISVGAILLTGLVLFLVSRTIGGSGALATAGSGASATAASHQFGAQTKTSGCVAHGGLPDAACTPGAVLSTATKAAICQSRYASSLTALPATKAHQVYGEYGLPNHPKGSYEMDRLVSLDLGGSNEIANLWPQAANPTPGFHQKDQVEHYLHDQVCSGAISLGDAQVQIATNWLSVYQSMPKPSPSSQDQD